MARILRLSMYAMTLILLAGLAACANEDDDDDGGGGGGPSGPQEISVARGATAVTDGGTDMLGSTAFGVSVPVVYTISNSGAVTLALTGTPVVAISGQSNCTAAVAVQPGATVSGGGNVSFTVNLNVASAAAFSFAVSIANDDTDENPFDFTASGTGATVPEIDLQRPAATSIASGGTDTLATPLAVGPNAAINWTIANLGSAVLNLSGTPIVQATPVANCTLTVTQPVAATVAAAASTTFGVAINVTGAGAFSFTASIASNDADENPYTFTVSGTGTSALPDIEVFSEFAAVANNGTMNFGKLAQDSAIALPFMIRNVGASALSISGAVTTGSATNCTATVREQPSTSVAPGATVVFTVYMKSNSAGNPSFIVSIPSNDPDENPFAFTFQAAMVDTTTVVYTRGTANGTELASATFPGAPTQTVLNPTLSAGASGVGAFSHHNTFVVYGVNASPTGPTDLIVRGFTGANQNITSSFTGTNGSASLAAAGRDNRFFYTAQSASSGVPSRLFSFLVTGTTAGAPVELTGSLPSGSPSGVSTIALSPRGDQVAMLADLDAAGTTELYVVPAAGGARVKVNATLSGGRTITFGSARWLPDNSGLLYVTQSGTGQARELWHVSLSGTPTATRLNAVPAATAAGVSTGSVVVALTGDRVCYISQQASGGTSEAYVVKFAAGVPATAVGMNSPTVPGTNGVSSLSIDNAGNRALFVADSGTSGERELFLSDLTTATPTTTKIVIATSGSGVTIASPNAFVTPDRAWFLQDDQAAGRNELFFLDLSVTPAATRILLNASFPGGSTGVSSTFVVLPHADGQRVVFASDQGNGSTGQALYRATWSSTPGAQRVNAASTRVNTFVMHGERLYFVRDNTNPPQHVFTATLSDATGAEVQLSSTEIGGSFGAFQLIPFSEDRVFYKIFTAGLDQFWSANATGTITRNQINAAGSSPADLATGAQ